MPKPSRPQDAARPVSQIPRKPPRRARPTSPEAPLRHLATAFEKRWRAEIACFTRAIRLTPVMAAAAAALRAHLTTPGKRVRPMLLLGGWRAFAGGRLVPPGVMSIAAALEFMHAFILVHDDIIDRADSRRGQPTLHRRLEEALGLPAATATAVALVLGDLAFNHAWRLLATAELPQKRRRSAIEFLASVFGETGAGELLESVNATRPLEAVDATLIARTYHAKTTRYTIEAPLVTGAMLGGASQAALRALAAASRPLGMAFQIENDAFEIDRLVEGGAIPDDFAAGVKTHALRLLHDRLTPAERDGLSTLVGIVSRDPAACARLAALFRDHAIPQALATDTQAAFSAARRILARARIPGPARRGIETTLAFLHGHRHHSEAAPAG